MGLRETLTRILIEYPIAKTAPLEGHALAQFIRSDAENAVGEALGSEADGLIIQGSPGQGNWAAVPWISIFDPAITTSATRGFYVVYLFHATKQAVHLSLNQGTPLSARSLALGHEPYSSTAESLCASECRNSRKVFL